MQSLGLDELATLTLDLGSITLGEMAAIEYASGRDFNRMLKGQVTRRLVALYLREWRSTGHEPNWNELSSLRPLDSGSSSSVSASAGHPPTSNG